MIYLQIIGSILFLISIGSMRIHRTKNADAMIENSISGKLLLSALPLLSFVMLILNLNNITNIKWYWNFVIATLFTFLLSVLLANIYSSILGYKSKPSISLMAGGYVKHNLHIIDAIITFVIGIILYFVSN